MLTRRGDFHYVLGDDLWEAFREWSREELPGLQQQVALNGMEKAPLQAGLVLFVKWLRTTGDGDVALRRIQEAPRQLFLPFPDEERPWTES